MMAYESFAAADGHYELEPILVDEDGDIEVIRDNDTCPDQWAVYYRPHTTDLAEWLDDFDHPDDARRYIHSLILEDAQEYSHG